jgi:hypothetical protein
MCELSGATLVVAKLSRNLAFLAKLQESGARFVAALAAAKARGVRLGGKRGNLEDLRKGPARSAEVRSGQAAERALKVRRQIEAIKGGIETTSLRQIAAALNERGIIAPRGEFSTHGSIQARCARPPCVAHRRRA